MTNAANLAGIVVNGKGFNLYNVQETWLLGQPSAAGITSAGHNLYTIVFNRNNIYYQGITWDVHMGGGKDWGGNGYMTYYARMMVTFSGTTASRVHVIQEYSRSYLNNSGTEVTYNTNVVSYDASNYFLTLNYKGINASDGYRPQMWITTYDAAYQSPTGTGQVTNVTIA